MACPHSTRSDAGACSLCLLPAGAIPTERWWLRGSPATAIAEHRATPARRVSPMGGAAPFARRPSVKTRKRQPPRRKAFVLRSHEMSAGQVAQLLGCSRQNVHQLGHALVPRRRGGNRVYLRTVVEAFAAERKASA